MSSKIKTLIIICVTLLFSACSTSKTVEDLEEVANLMIENTVEGAVEISYKNEVGFHFDEMRYYVTKSGNCITMCHYIIKKKNTIVLEDYAIYNSELGQGGLSVNYGTNKNKDLSEYFAFQDEYGKVCPSELNDMTFDDLWNASEVYEEGAEMFQNAFEDVWDEWWNDYSGHPEVKDYVTNKIEKGEYIVRNNTIDDVGV